MSVQQQHNETLQQQQLLETLPRTNSSQQELFHEDTEPAERQCITYSSLDADQPTEHNPNEPKHHWICCLCYHLLIIVTTLQLGPMLYLTAHEGGHCLLANVFGMQSQLYLGCTDSLPEGHGLYDPHRKVVVCPPFGYSLLAQHGFCMYDTQLTGITTAQDALICVAGGLAGAILMYLLLMLVASIAIAYQHRYQTSWITTTTTITTTNVPLRIRWGLCWNNTPLTRPFRLYAIIQQAIGARALMKSTAVVFSFLSWIIYVMNVNRLFYSLVPTTPDALRFPRDVSDLVGDGYDLWRLLASSRFDGVGEILIVAQVFQILQYAVQIVMFVWFVRMVRKIGRASNRGEVVEEEEEEG